MSRLREEVTRRLLDPHWKSRFQGPKVVPKWQREYAPTQEIADMCRWALDPDYTGPEFRLRSTLNPHRDFNLPVKDVDMREFF